MSPDATPVLKPEPGPLVVRMVSTVKYTGVLYEVYAGPWLQWSRFVALGKRRKYHPGGAAFRTAAREQEQQAKDVAALIDVGRLVAKHAECGIRLG